MQILCEACSWNHYITFLILMICIINFKKDFIKAERAEGWQGQGRGWDIKRKKLKCCRGGGPLALKERILHWVPPPKLVHYINTLGLILIKWVGGRTALGENK